MTCPSDETLSLYVDGALDGEAAAAIETHARACTACHDRTRALGALDTLLQQPEPLPVGMLQRALEIPERRARRDVPVLVVGCAAASLAVVLLLTGVLSPRRHDDTTRAPFRARVDAPPVVEFAARVCAALLDPGPDAASFLDEAGDRALGVLHRIALERDGAPARAAVRRLGRLGRRESLPVLLEAVERVDRREVALDALGRLGDERALAAIEPLLDDARLGHLALDAAVAIGGAEAAAVLARRVERPNGTLDPAVLLSALGRVDGIVGARVLARLLEDDVHGAGALAALRANETTLLPHLHADAAAFDAVRATRALAALERVASPASVPVLETLLRVRSRRAEVARILARIDTDSAAAVLVAAADRPAVRDAFRAAGRQTEAWLLASLEDASHRECVRAVDLLGLCGRDGAVRQLERLATDPALAPHVVTALGRIGGDGAADALARLAACPSLRRPAVEALGWTGAPTAVDLLVCLGRDERGLRDVVYRALGRLGTSEAVAAILRLDERRGTGGRAVRALQGMERKIVVPALLSMLDGDDAPDARRALAGLGHRVPRGPRTLAH